MHSFHDPALGRLAALAASLGAEMKSVPASTGIGAPGTQPAPASLARSPIATSAPPASGVPFPRASTLATMKDEQVSLGAGKSKLVQLQTNAFLENVIMDVSLVTAGNSAAVAFAKDAPWNIFNQVQLTDPSGSDLISPISGYALYLLNKYLPDVECRFDPKTDPNYSAVTGTVATGGSVSFRLVIPVEHRRRNALGAVNNSAANQRYRLTLTTVSAFSSLYSTAPTTEPTTVTIQLTQQYWTSPPAVIKSKTGTLATEQEPAGLGTVGFVRYEEHTPNGTAPFQLTNVGDYISSIIFVLRDATTVRDGYAPPKSTTSANWPQTFAWIVNDFQVHNLSAYGPAGPTSARGIGGTWPREMARYYGYKNAYTSAGGLDEGVYTLPQLYGLFTQVVNFGTSNQYLPTDATTKLQVRGYTWGSHAKAVQVYVRILRPSSAAALFS